MASTVATRRSPRSIKTLCNDTIIPLLNYEQTAVLLSLAHCTGWSADQIASKVVKFTDVVLSPEILWDYHWSWVLGRNRGEDLSTFEWETMQMLMRAVDVEMAEAGRPLSQTARPKTIKFAEQWCAKNSDGRPLFPGYTADTREASKSFLLVQKTDEAFGRLSPIEEEVLSIFGENMLFILRDTLKRWAVAMWAKLREHPGLRPIREREHIELIMEYLKVFQKLYEDRFGEMENGKPMSAFGKIKDNTVFVKSTGYGVKVVLGLLMADRIHVVERLRKLGREMVGFVEVEPEDLEHDAKDCPICQDPMGIESPEGSKEAPLRMVICCGQVIGSACLRAWLGQLAYQDKYRDSCPTCRFQFPDTFLENLFSKDEYAARVAKERVADDLVSPSPDSADPMRSQQGQDAQLQGEIGERTSREEGEIVVDSDLEVFSPPPVTGARQVIINTTLGFIDGFEFGQVELGELAEGEVMEDDFDMEG